ncbi:scavenger receptor class F member 1-like isoform X1 [Haliotis rufescens]|uniref:scavenger receptor class F member 1-like isoform X1 n=2 Tax=Haliotis rufescens TaxID=6454 RepID=UPI001EB03ADC|nr:scavenger receptor class F member 1-like isoform X1 [Haliotis rufescens]
MHLGHTWVTHGQNGKFSEKINRMFQMSLNAISCTQASHGRQVSGKLTHNTVKILMMWKTVSLVAMFIALMVLVVLYVKSTIKCGDNCLRSNFGTCIECVVGWYGAECTKKCQGCKDICEKHTGRCKQCQPGYFSDECNRPCALNCRVSFDVDRHCDRDTGRCLDGCVPGRWGHQCERLCTSTCGQSLCEQDRGTCLFGCTDGWYGRLCDEPCPHNCGVSYVGNRSCNQDTGKCLEGCVPGRWGRQCERLCSSTCEQSACDQDEGTCHHGCTDGWFGLSCDTPCPENCLVNRCNIVQGYCGHCKPGFIGRKCDIQCRNCADNTCTYNELLSSVSCTKGCVKGWTDEDCQSPCSNRCLDEDCNINGTCKRCPDGYYGDMCSVSCAPTCLRCMQISGICTQKENSNNSPSTSMLVLSYGSLAICPRIWMCMLATICYGLSYGWG